jgi:hypothetical protein
MKMANEMGISQNRLYVEVNAVMKNLVYEKGNGVSLTYEEWVYRNWWKYSDQREFARYLGAKE